MRVIKKYSNRRLYDTSDSCYITLEELAARIRSGHDVQVVDAKTAGDLTQLTLAQIIMESRGGSRLLPVPLLTQLIRLGDDALADFFGRWVSFALEAYVAARQSAQAAAGLNPLTAMLSGSNPFARLWSGWGGEPARTAAPSWPEPPRPVPPPSPSTTPTEAATTPPPSEVAVLRRELDALKKSLRRRKR
jgi:polyhydroxyalkanoate synthesis repressor PhaR